MAAVPVLIVTKIQVSHISLCLGMYWCVLSGLVWIGKECGRIDVYGGMYFLVLVCISVYCVCMKYKPIV